MHYIELFDRGYSLNPAATCFIDDVTGHRYTYAETRNLSLRIAHGLKARGFGEETSGAVLSFNDATAFTCGLGLLRAGLTWTFVNPLSSVAENIYLLGLFGCKVLFYHSQFSDIINRIRQEVPSLEFVICIDAEDTKAEQLSSWANRFPASEIELTRRPDALAILAGTGGTTGLPKGVMHSRRSFFVAMAAIASIEYYNDRPPVYLSAAPMTHAGGVVCLAVLARGGTIIVQPGFEPEKFLSAIPRYRVSSTFLPPTAIYMLLSHPRLQDFEYSSLRHLIYGAAPMSPDKLKEAVNAFGPVMTQIYGQTECFFPITYLSPQDHANAVARGDDQRLMSCGKPAMFSRLAIMDANGKLLPNREIGEIVIRTESLMSGYFNDTASTEQVGKYGWHHTGDVGYRDDEGFYYIVDRLKDMIISGGFNVFSAEVERALLAHPAVRECAVIGVPDEKWGEAVKAIVELKSGQVIEAEDLIEHCRELIGAVKAPKTVDVVEQLPRSAVGKVLKRALREKYWSGQDRRVH